MAAAIALGLSPPAVSRAIGRLESRLGVRLFQRTTRRVSLTDDGRLYFKECREALGQIAAAEDVLSGRRRAPAGHLRISAPATYAHHRLMARAGAGLVQIYHFVAGEVVARGELVEVLHRYAGATRPFTVLYPQNRHLSPRVRAFVDFLVSAARQQPDSAGSKVRPK